MQRVIAAIFAALLAVFGFAFSSARADEFVAGGSVLPSPVPFEVLADQEEVLAPAAAALRHLGVTVTAASDGRVDLRAANGAHLTARVGSTAALVNGQERTLPAAPLRRGEHLLLPVRITAWHLGLAYRWDPETRTIYLHPRVGDITFSRLPDKVRVKITASAPVTYAAGVLREPPRIYLDVAPANLFAAEQQIAVNEGDLIAVRASQHSLNPNIVRVVLDLQRDPETYHHSAADEGRSIVVEIPAPRAAPEAEPGVVAVRSVRLEARSAAVCTLTIEAAGNPVASLFSRHHPPQAVIELSNAFLESEVVEGEHEIVESAVAEQISPNQARIVLNLKQPQPAALVRREVGVCVLIGRVPLSDVTVVLDPGHGGRQMGAVGRSGLEEKAINLAVALRAEKLLQEAGARVMMTRREDTSLIPLPAPTAREELRRELTMRSGVANTCDADLFISIHCNAGARSQHGTETYYFTPRSLGLAKVMQHEMLRHLGRKDGGVRSARFVVVREAMMPAVLLELAYLSHPEEEALLGSPDFQQQAAQAILTGVERFAQEGGLLNYYAELEASRWTRAVVERPSPEPDAPQDKPGAAGAPQPADDDAGAGPPTAADDAP